MASSKMDIFRGAATAELRVIMDMYLREKNVHGAWLAPNRTMMARSMKDSVQAYWDVEKTFKELEMEDEEGTGRGRWRCSWRG